MVSLSARMHPPLNVFMAYRAKLPLTYGVTYRICATEELRCAHVPKWCLDANDLACRDQNHDDLMDLNELIHTGTVWLWVVDSCLWCAGKRSTSRHPLARSDRTLYGHFIHVLYTIITRDSMPNSTSWYVACRMLLCLFTLWEANMVEGSYAMEKNHLLWHFKHRLTQNSFIFCCVISNPNRFFRNTRCFDHLSSGENRAIH